MAKVDGKAKQDFHEAARDRVVRGKTDMDEGDLRETFNDTAEFAEGAERAGEDEDDRAPTWKQRTDEHAQKRRRRRGKGYGYRRNDD